MKTSKIISIVFIVILAGCAKMKPNENKAVQLSDNTVLEKELKPTDFTNSTTDMNSDYELPPTEIVTKTGTLKLGQTQFSDVNYSYDAATESLQISAHLKILSSDRKIISETEVVLSGNHSKNLGTANLNQKNTDPKNPIIRAKVTCLNSNDQDEFLCDRAVVDFFVLFDKQYYTDQFETVTKKPEISDSKFISDQPKKADPVTQPEEKTPVVETEELQSEGAEDSRESRYQGQVQSTNLQELFFPDSERSSDDLSRPIETVIPQIGEQSVPQPEKNTVAVEPIIEPIIGPSNDKKTNLTVVAEIEKQKKPAEQTINSNIKQTETGALRAFNQAVGFPDQGSLRNSTSLLLQQNLAKETAYYKVAFPARERFYSTYEMSQMISKLGRFVNNQSKDLKLFVGNISARRGGFLAPHKSHQIGMDVDIAYPTDSSALAEKSNFPVVVLQSQKKINKQSYSVEKTFELFKFAFQQNEYPVDRIFVDRLIIQDMCEYAKEKNKFKGADKQIVEKIFQNIEHVDGHGDHFHMRLKCTDSQPACRSKIYKKTMGCVVK